MEGLSRAYRRRTRWWVFALGIVVAVGFNVDALRVVWSIVGWFIAAAAIAQGAPFWFDVLRRVAGFKRGALSRL